jgi:hypothetical protein
MFKKIATLFNLSAKVQAQQGEINRLKRHLAKASNDIDTVTNWLQYKYRGSADYVLAGRDMAARARRGLIER